MTLDSTHLLQGAWISRLFFGAGFLFSAVYNHSFVVALFQMLVAIVLLQLVDGSSRRLIRAGRLLQWIVLPMILIHALFSPGRLIDFGWLHISVDGAIFGGWLAFHFVTIFMAALLFFRILTTDEWVHLIAMTPSFRTQLLTYMVLARSLRTEMATIIARYRRVWQQGRKGIGRLFLILLLIIRRVMDTGKIQAGRVWHEWDGEMENLLTQKDEVAAASMAWTLFWPFFAIGWIGLVVGVVN